MESLSVVPGTVSAQQMPPPSSSSLLQISSGRSAGMPAAGTMAALRNPDPPERHQMAFRTPSSAASQASQIPGFLAARSGVGGRRSVSSPNTRLHQSGQ